MSAAALDLDGDGQAPVARRGDLGLAGLVDAGQAHAATSSGKAGPHLTITSLKAATHEDLAGVRQRFERLLAEYPELRELSERLDREREVGA